MELRPFIGRKGGEGVIEECVVSPWFNIFMDGRKLNVNVWKSSAIPSHMTS